MLSTKFTITEDQLLVAKLYNTSVNPAIKKRRILSWLMIPVLYGVLGYIFWANGKGKMTYFFFAFSFLWILLYPLWEGRRFKRSYKNGLKRSSKDLLNQQRELQFADEITIISADKTETYSYQELSSVVEIKQYFLLLFEKERTIALPKANASEELLQHLQKKNVTLTNKLKWRWI